LKIEKMKLLIPNQGEIENYLLLIENKEKCIKIISVQAQSQKLTPKDVLASLSLLTRYIHPC